MSTPTNDGGPAFPTKVSGYKCTEQVADDLFSFSGPFPGMSLRDYFAAKAMAALIRNYTNEKDFDAFTTQAKVRNLSIPALFAAMAYENADAMLAARNQTTT